MPKTDKSINRLIPFHGLASGAFSAAPIDEESLLRGTLVVRTNRGNFATIDARPGDALQIDRLVVYSPQGLILKVAKNLTVPSGHALDVDSGRVGTHDGDFWWRAVPDRARVIERHLDS